MASSTEYSVDVDAGGTEFKGTELLRSRFDTWERIGSGTKHMTKVDLMLFFIRWEGEEKWRGNR